MQTPSAAWLSARNTVLALSLLAANGCSQRSPAGACGPVAHQLSDPAEPANRAAFRQGLQCLRQAILAFNATQAQLKHFAAATDQVSSGYW